MWSTTVELGGGAELCAQLPQSLAAYFSAPARLGKHSIGSGRREIKRAEFALGTGDVDAGGARLRLAQ